MKITIEKVYNPINDEHYFWLTAEGSVFSKAFNFKPGVPEDDIWNETKNYEAALEIALRIEKAGSYEQIREVVYTTETTEENINTEAVNT